MRHCHYFFTLQKNIIPKFFLAASLAFLSFSFPSRIQHRPSSFWARGESHMFDLVSRDSSGTTYHTHQNFGTRKFGKWLMICNCNVDFPLAWYCTLQLKWLLFAVHPHSRGWPRWRTTQRSCLGDGPSHDGFLPSNQLCERHGELGTTY